MQTAVRPWELFAGKGLEKLRHVNVAMLWVQDIREEGDVQFEKIPGVANPADLMTKHVPNPLLEDHCRRLMVEAVGGRAEKSSRVCKGVEDIKAVTHCIGKTTVTKSYA